MSALVLVCGAMFDGVSEQLRGRTEILVRDGLICEIGILGLDPTTPT